MSKVKRKIICWRKQIGVKTTNIDLSGGEKLPHKREQTVAHSLQLMIAHIASLQAVITIKWFQGQGLCAQILVTCKYLRYGTHRCSACRSTPIDGDEVRVAWIIGPKFSTSLSKSSRAVIRNLIEHKILPLEWTLQKRPVKYNSKSGYTYHCRCLEGHGGEESACSRSPTSRHLTSPSSQREPPLVPAPTEKSFRGRVI